MIEWISVKEKLPTTEGHYLCWKDELIHNNSGEYFMKIKFVIRNDGQKYWHGVSEKRPVTHWAKINPPEK